MSSSAAPVQRLALPIDPELPRILKSLDETGLLLLQAEPGAGKTTRVPPALLDSRWGEAGEIWVLEPRRLAAKLSAERVAFERGSKVGAEVGYLFRFETRTGPQTRLKFLTEGLLIRELVKNPELTGVSCVVLDEFHERHLHTDLSFALIRKLQQTSRPDLGLVIMSATLESDRLQEKLADAPLIQVKGRVFPVETEYLGDSDRHLESTVTSAVLHALSDPRAGEGNVLVFLPGMREIRRAEEALAGSREFRASGAEVAILHAELDREEQDRAIRVGGPRRVILSTNVAETSVTIPGIRAVIDSGLHRRAQISPWTGLPSLQLRPISRASAIQRAGRAGRTAAGICLRLYSKGSFNQRPAFDRPEIQRAELSQTLLELVSMGFSNPETLDWLDPPPDGAWASSKKLLLRLGLAVESGEDGLDLTADGREAVKLPIPPRMGALLLEARKRGVFADALSWVAECLEGEVPEGEFLSFWSSNRARSAFQAERLKTRLQSLLKNEKGISEAPKIRSPEWERGLLISVLRGFSDRGAKWLKDREEIQFGSGGTASSRGKLFHSPLLVICDAVEHEKGRVQVRAYAEIEEDWLVEFEPSPMTEETEIRTEGAKGRLERVLKWKWDSLTLSESRSPLSDESEASSLLARALKDDRSFWNRQTRFVDLQLRLKLIERDLVGDARALELRPLTAAEVVELLEQVAFGKTSLEAVKSEDLAAFWLALDPSRAKRLAELAPEEWVFPHQKKAKIHYLENQPPWMESRLQDFFGQSITPRVLGGKVALTLHLLAPNFRAVQVTQDLPSFWKNFYPQLKSELSRRYPRHFWPEDPLTAEPRQFLKPRRS